MSTLFLIRHGESEWNRQGRIQGQADSPLSRKGLAQAQAVGERLLEVLGRQPVRIYSSPLSRAKDTAAAIALALGQDPSAIIVDQRLNDFNQGDITGTLGWDRVAQERPELARMRLQDPHRYHPPNGESGAEFDRRLRAFLNDLETSVSNDRSLVVLVSHGIANKYIRSIRRDISGAAIIALDESQQAIYRLEGEVETTIEVPAVGPDTTAQIVPVELGSRSYQIVIAARLIEHAEAYLRPIITGRRVAVVSDAFVAESYLANLTPTLDTLASRWDSYLIDGGERAKSFAGLESLLGAMLADGVDRSCLVVAFGGGVVGDVAGFAAALLMRGIELVQVPTTLMSQVDSAVGGKNAINTVQGKNLVGSFLQPRIVLNDVSLLASLPAAELRAGYGEIIKYGLLRGEAEFAWLESNARAIMACDENALIKVVRMGCETKAAIVSEDELDQGKRALVNLGHTFAHAFEASAGYGHFPHGAAVAVGLVAACELSERTGVGQRGLADRVRKHTGEVGLPTDLTGLSATVGWRADAIHQHMLHDKKTVGGSINFVLLRHLGDAFVTADVSRQEVGATLAALGAG